MRKATWTIRSLCLMVAALMLAACLMGGCGKKNNTQEPTEGWESLPMDQIPVPTGDNQQTGNQTEETQPDGTQPPREETTQPPADLPSSVIIPPATDPSTGENLGIQFPYDMPDYGIKLHKLAPYSGMFVEDGSNATVENVAMVMVENYGDFPLEYAQLTVTYDSVTLTFDITAMPVGENLVVQEKSGQAMPDTAATGAQILVVQGASMEMSEQEIRVTDNGDNTLTVENLTDKTIPTVRVFYKYYMENENIFVGGIAFTLKITQLKAGESVTVQPNHYTSQTSRIVMVQTYE